MRWLDYSSEDGYEYCETRWFYAVAIGRHTGIFTRLEEANQQVYGFPGFCMRKFSDYEDAREYLEEFEIYCDSLTEEEEEEEEGEENQEEDDDRWFYAVAVGRSTGVFLDYENARDQIFRFPGTRMDTFLEYDDAVKYIEKTNLLLMEEKKRKEEEEKKTRVWFYAVAVGRSTGVFMDYQDAMNQVRGYSGSQMKKFSDFEEAQEYIAFNQVYSSDGESEEEQTWFYAVAVGRCVGIYTNHDTAMEQVLGYSGFRMKKFEDYGDAKEYMHKNQSYYNADKEKCEELAPQVEEVTWYYAVAVGRVVGIYRCPEIAIAQVHGYPGFRMRKFPDLEDAQAYIRSFQVCYSEEEEKSEEPEPDEGYTAWFYAVAVGRSIGIYTTYEDAIKQVHGYSGCRMKKFQNYDEAEEYIDFNQAYSLDGDRDARASEYEDETEPEPDEEIWHYAVAVGRRIGIYTDFENAQAQVHGYSGFLMKKFLDYDEAAAYVEINKCASDEEWESDEPVEEDDGEKWYYAVAVGRDTGIYTDHEDAVDQVHGYSGFRMKKFLDYSDAQAYIRNIREHYSGKFRGYDVQVGCPSGWS
uniref:ribonuclease H n=1 Tax=Phytophthora ramorum TaxID=164328 RepID=H3H652_PHYRM